jgi:hypothetical protein
MLPDEEVGAIKAIIARQFESLNWTQDVSADWQKFAADFFPDASLYPSARPAKRQIVDDFVARMKSLAGTTLQTFRERVLGTEVRVFGNVAVASVACEVTENEAVTSRSVEMMLFINDNGQWRIVAQAWDGETPTRLIPASLTD